MMMIRTYVDDDDDYSVFDDDHGAFGSRGLNYSRQRMMT
jgi:hypothetical protein